MIFKKMRSGIIGAVMLLSLNSCGPVGVMVIHTVGFYIGALGKQFIMTSAGLLAERAVDAIMDFVEGKNKESSTLITPHSHNPLKGYLTHDYNIKISGQRDNQAYNTDISMKGAELDFERVDINSEWQPTVESQRKVKEVTKIGCAQLSLKSLGYNPGVIDGKMGKMTRSAIREFQKYTFGLTSTGKLDDDTLKKLLGDQFIQSGK